MTLTYEDEIVTRAGYVARVRHSTHGSFVDIDDLRSELNTYALGVGRRRLEGWLQDEDEAHRVDRALFARATIYCETAKAEQSGYKFGDLAWYSPDNLATLVPLALDPTFDGITGENEDIGMPRAASDGGEGNNLLAMVVDIRRVLPSGAFASDYDPETEVGMDHLEQLSQKLGGEYPDAPGYSLPRRRIQSNAQAIAETHRGY